MGAHLQHGSHALGAEDADGGLAVRSLAEQKQSPGHKGVSRTAPRPLAWGTRRLAPHLAQLLGRATSPVQILGRLFVFVPSSWLKFPKVRGYFVVGGFGA